METVLQGDNYRKKSWHETVKAKNSAFKEEIVTESEILCSKRHVIKGLRLYFKWNWL